MGSFGEWRCEIEEGLEEPDEVKTSERQERVLG